MSGGHWDYQQFHIEERGQWLKGLLDLVAQVEHQLDWGISCDTCLQCAKLRVAEAFIRFFDGDTDAALAILKDRDQNRCLRCQAR